MCFSAAASFTASAVLATIGIINISITRTARQTMLASIPLWFSIQQAAEGIVWLTIGNQTSLIFKAAVYLFAGIALCVWPIWIPMSVLKLETNKIRRKLIILCTIIGFFVSAYFLITLLYYGSTAKVIAHHIYYHITPLFDYEYVSEHGLILYCLATILPFLISSKRGMWLFGILLAISAASAYFYWYFFFVSIWCFFAAFLSALLYKVIQWQNTNRLIFEI